MPPADPRASEIIRTVVEFEKSVSLAERALVARDWPGVDAALSAQHRLTHALQNLFDETHDQRPQAFTDEVQRRISVIVGQRNDQLRRLIAYNHLVKERLTTISRSREMRRLNVEARPAARILDTLQ